VIFGEGRGLVRALAHLQSSFASIDEVRTAGQIVAVDLLEATAEERIGPADLDQVMGLPTRPGSGTEAERTAAEGIGGGATVFLGQFDEDGGNMWELWKERDDVACEFLCWLLVARQRLVTVGKIAPFPDLGV
jgi:hypothetical protein